MVPHLVVFQIRASHFFFSDQSVEALREHLSPHIDLSALAAAMPKEEVDSSNGAGQRDWLSYSGDDSIISDDDDDSID